ncbi:MAG: Crp/Fnr family transcriptional regulator, partial [Gammaproteobacteria bacterium]|nr:Crp/Fnr family transcriptional regulator [Gammaproteobacteria bacterium]
MLYCGMVHSRIRTKKTSRRAAAATAASGGNLLLAALPTDESSWVIARCEPVELAFGEVLYEQGDCIRHVYFPTASFISLLS